MTILRSAAWKIWLGYGLAAAAIVFAARYLGLNRSAFISAISELAPTSLLLATVAFALHVLINAMAFAPLNHAFGVSARSSTLTRTWAATLLAKYIPGGIWHVVGRGLLLAKLGVPARTTAAVGMAEQGISLALCALIAAAFFWMFVAASWWRLALVGIGSLALIFVPPRVFTLFRHPLRAELFRRALLGYAIAMVPYALGYVVIVAPEAPARFLGALFAGTIAGVLALPVPGGLGIRESATSLLALSAQPARLFAGMLAARALIFGVEVLVSLLSLRGLRRRNAA
jgi:hypothetical protein